MNKRREFPEGIYSTQDARANFRDIVELVSKGQPVVLMNYKRVVLVIGAIPLPPGARKSLRDMGINPEEAESEYHPRYFDPPGIRSRTPKHQDGPKIRKSRRTAVPPDIEMAFKPTEAPSGETQTAPARPAFRGSFPKPDSQKKGRGK